MIKGLNKKTYVTMSKKDDAPFSFDRINYGS